MTRCRHRGPVLIIEYCRGQRIHYPERALPVEMLELGPGERVQARCLACGYAVTVTDGEALPRWAQRAWRRARG